MKCSVTVASLIRENGSRDVVAPTASCGKEDLKLLWAISTNDNLTTLIKYIHSRIMIGMEVRILLVVQDSQLKNERRHGTTFE